MNKPSLKKLRQNLHAAVEQIRKHGLENPPPKDIYHIDYGWVLKDGKEGPNFQSFVNAINRKNMRDDDSN